LFSPLSERAPRCALFLLLISVLAFSQDQGDPRARARAVRDLGKQGVDAITKIAPYVRDPDLGVRLEAVKALCDIGGPKTLDALLAAARDNDPEIQIRATDGLVNIYYPGYLKSGLSGTLQRAGTSIRAHFTDTNDQVIDGFVQVRPEVIEVLGRLSRGGASLESRANAARGAGVLRGRAAVPDLIEALHSKDNRLMYEALIALQKIGDPSAAPRMAFLLRDLEEKIQITALETTGLLRNRDAAPDVRDALEHARTVKVRRAAIQALAQIADPADHPRFISFLADKDDASRASAAEGLGRLKNAVDRGLLDKTFAAERATNARLAEAFALAMLGNLDTGDLSPFKYLIDTLNRKSYQGVAQAFLIELARDLPVRQAVYSFLPRATADEKIGICTVLARSGDKDSVPLLEGLSMDANPEVAAEGVRSLRTLRARLP
jgi:HEAT repeat protein